MKTMEIVNGLVFESIAKQAISTEPREPMNSDA